MALPLMVPARVPSLTAKNCRVPIGSRSTLVSSASESTYGWRLRRSDTLRAGRTEVDSFGRYRTNVHVDSRLDLVLVQAGALHFNRLPVRSGSLRRSPLSHARMLQIETASDARRPRRSWSSPESPTQASDPGLQLCDLSGAVICFSARLSPVPQLMPGSCISPPCSQGSRNASQLIDYLYCPYLIKAGSSSRLVSKQGNPHLHHPTFAPLLHQKTYIQFVDFTPLYRPERGNQSNMT